MSLAPFPGARLAQLTETVRSVVLLESAPYALAMANRLHELIGGTA